MNRFLHIASTVSLALIILAKMMAMPIFLMQYSLNKNFIAENLCENKAKPEMHCNGKCYLSKKLAKGNDNQDAQNQKGGTKITITDFCESIDKTSFKLSPLNLQYFAFYNVSGVPDRNITAVFRPPIA